MRGLHGKAANSETTPLLTAKKTSYFTKLKSLFPYLFPDTLKLKFLTVLCMLLLLAQRVVNLLVPLYFKLIIDSLAPTPEFAWPVILIYILFRLLQGSGGLLANLQSFLWIRVSQFTSRKISVEMLRHLHNLSLEFHLKRKTGEVLRVMDRGTSSVGSLLSMLLFNIVPIFIDIAVAIVSFVVLFDWTFGLIVFIAILIYIILTIVITEWRTRFRREMIDLDNAFSARAVDSLLNFESVKYFNAESWEVDQYDNAIKKYQDADWKSQSSLNVLNVSQNLVITAGLLAGCLLCAYRVAVLKNSTVGDFVLFMTYLTQLYAPLNWMIQQNFIDMENMLDLLTAQPTIVDSEDAIVLDQNKDGSGGKIQFDNVCFSYNQEVALQDISFTILPGQKVALVGPTGGGKRLIFRFYDVDSGRVLIDDHDVQSVTQSSLRSRIGVVPQDTVLFNDTISYNIKYGCPDATQLEVEEAARLAQIHQKIVEFPDKYDTKVGERGMRLSGGEKQRVSIARTILKNPSIILLDEATSALDNSTERIIKESLQNLSHGRTSFTIAHRLQTIIDSDVILVLDGGRIVERGTHKELLSAGNGKGKGKDGQGVYYKLWMEQEEKEKKMEEEISLVEVVVGDKVIKPL